MTTSTILYINTGTSANKGDGDSLRLAFHKVNKNFELLGVTTGFNTDAVKDTVSEIFTQGVGYGIRYIYNTSTHVMISSLTTATSTSLGAVKPGSGITISADGTISAATAYVLPTATNVVLGGIRIGIALAADQYGVLNNTGVTGIRPSSSQPYRSGQVTLSQSDIEFALGYPPANQNTVGQLNGIATLDGNGKVPLNQMNEAVLGGLNFQGTWNASTNANPTITSGVGTKGFYYKVSVAGTVNIDGINVWNVGDIILYNGTTWLKIDGTTNEIISVNGYNNGAVVLTHDDIGGWINRDRFGSTSTATTTMLGTIKIGQGLVGAGDGTINVTEALLGNANPATTATLGTIIVGDGLLITPQGVLSAKVGSSGNITFQGNEIQTIEAATDLILRPTSGITKFYNTLLHMGGNNNLVLRTNQFLNAGLATDSTNFSLRIVGDSNVGTTLFDAGVYNSPIATTGWSSKMLLTKAGNLTIQGNLRVNGAGGITFQDGTIQTTAAIITTATNATIGGVIVGNGLTIDGAGVLSIVTGATGGQITDVSATRGTIASGTEVGDPGMVSFDGSYLYLCISTNIWARIPIADVPGQW